MRVLKFRVWNTDNKRFEKNLALCIDDITSVAKPWFCIDQYTGRKGFNGKELYEGDIVFYEEHEDEGDVRYYLAVIWIAEWDMFGSLHIDEYKEYLTGGVEALDETMFWTYNLRDSENFHYAGNIYQNPELLK